MSWRESAPRRSVPFSGNRAELFNDILTDIAKIGQFVRGAGEASFEHDDAISYTVKYALRISEAAHRLGDRAPDLWPQIPWRDVRALGNRLRHAYDSVNARLIWLIVEKDIPPLKIGVEAALRRLVEGEEEPPPSPEPI
jgi:uncharacterized protein with HEPN domain